MGKKEAGMVEQLGECIEKYCGKKTATNILKGSEIVSDASNEEIAIWMKIAIDRLDSIADRDTISKIMEECGRNCCRLNSSVLKRFKKNRKKFDTLDEFLDAEQKNPMRGTRLIRKGNTLHVFYMPRTYNPSIRCYCNLVMALPDDEKMSMSYCQCSVGFAKALWENVLERPVNVKVIRSAISGSDECELEISF